MVNATISGVKSSITLIWVLFLFVYFIFMASRLSDMFSSLSFLKQPASMSERLDYLPLKQGVACSILSRMLIFFIAFIVVFVSVILDHFFCSVFRAKSAGKLSSTLYHETKNCRLLLQFKFVKC